MIFVGIQVILKFCAVPSLLALTLAYAVVRLAASRQPKVHSSNCRTAVAVAVVFGTGIIGNVLWALLGLLLVLAAPRPFLWWPVEPPNTEFPAALLTTSSPEDAEAPMLEEDEEMQVVQATAESLSAASGGSRFDQAVAVGDALAVLRASRGVGAASTAAEFEVAVVALGETRQLPSARPSSAPEFSLKPDHANREANLQSWRRCIHTQGV